jgi:PIN domain nuclease of toxin-antitoxin system
MKLLIDSHVLIWLSYESRRISQTARQRIDEADRVYVSTVSLWELAIKFINKKLEYSPEDLLKAAEALGLAQLNIETEHIVALANITLPHRDPFDHMLLAQAQAEGCALLTSDKQLLSTNYPTVPV